MAPEKEGNINPPAPPERAGREEGRRGREGARANLALKEEVVVCDGPAGTILAGMTSRQLKETASLISELATQTGNFVRIEIEPPGASLEPDSVATKGGAKGVVKAVCLSARATRQKRLFEFNVRIASLLVTILTQYVAVSIYASVFAFLAMLNGKFAGWIRKCGEPLLLTAMGCFVVSVLIEQFEWRSRAFYSNLFNGLFLAGLVMYFSVWPPLGSLPCATLLGILTAVAIYATVLLMLNCGHTDLKAKFHYNQERPWEGSGLGCGLYVYGMAVVPAVVLVLSQLLYFLYAGFNLELGYREYSANVVTGLGMAMLITYERFRFLYYTLRAERDQFLKMETVLVTLVKEIEPDTPDE